MHESKYEIVEGLNYYICDSIPTDDEYSRRDRKKSTTKPIKKFDFNLELQKLANVPVTKEQKDSKFHQELENLINFYKNSRLYRDINGNRITQKGKIMLTPYQKMIKINEEIKNFYDNKMNKTTSPLIVKNNLTTNGYLFNKKKNYDRKTIIQNLKKNSSNKFKILDNNYKIITLKNKIKPKKNYYNDFSQTCPDRHNIKSINNSINNLNKEDHDHYCLSEIPIKKKNFDNITLIDKKIVSTLSNLKYAKNYSSLNSKERLNKYFYDSDFNQINKWELKLLTPNITDQYSQRQKTLSNFSREHNITCSSKFSKDFRSNTQNKFGNVSKRLKNYNLIQFNMNQLLKKDLKHKNKFILNVRKNLYDKKARLSEVIASKRKSCRNRNIKIDIKKGHTLNN